LDELRERRGYSHLKEEALDHTMWRAGFGPVVRQTTKWINELESPVGKVNINRYRYIKLDVPCSENVFQLLCKLTSGFKELMIITKYFVVSL
jgi:hypothetical protein